MCQTTCHCRGALAVGLKRHKEVSASVSYLQQARSINRCCFRRRFDLVSRVRNGPTYPLPYRRMTFPPASMPWTYPQSTITAVQNYPAESQMMRLMKPPGRLHLCHSGIHSLWRQGLNQRPQFARVFVNPTHSHHTSSIRSLPVNVRCRSSDNLSLGNRNMFSAP